MSDISPEAFIAVAEFAAQAAPALARALSLQFSREVEAGEPDYRPLAAADFSAQTGHVVSGPLTLDDGLQALLLLPEEGARGFADLQAGLQDEPPTDGPLEQHLARLEPAMEALTQALAAFLLNQIGRKVDITLGNLSFGSVPPIAGLATQGTAFEIRLPLRIPEMVQTSLMLVFPAELLVLLSPAPPPGAGMSASNTTQEQDTLQELLGTASRAELDFRGIEGAHADRAPGASAAWQGVPDPFGRAPGPDAVSGMERGMNMVMDIPLDVTVELGHARMLIKDVLELGSGSVVELDRVAGEPVDVLVNGRLVAKGEVIVIEDNFGIRITEIVSPADRVSGLGKRT